MTWWVNISKNACLHFPFTKLTVLKMVVTVKHVHAYPKTNMHTLKQIWYYLHHYKKYQQAHGPPPKQCMLPLVVAIYRKNIHVLLYLETHGITTTETPWKKKMQSCQKSLDHKYIHSNMQQPQVIIKHRVGIYYFKYCVTYLGNHSCHASVTRMTTLMQHHLQWHLTHKHKDLGMAWTQLVLIWAHG